MDKFSKIPYLRKLFWYNNNFNADKSIIIYDGIVMLKQMNSKFSASILQISCSLSSKTNNFWFLYFLKSFNKYEHSIYWISTNQVIKKMKYKQKIVNITHELNLAGPRPLLLPDRYCILFFTISYNM